MQIYQVFLQALYGSTIEKCAMLIMTIVTNDRLRCIVRKVWPLKQSKKFVICF